MNSKNILVLTPTPSHPQDAGNRKRIYALTKYLQELGATIYFVYCPREWDREIPKEAYDGMRQCWDYFFIAYPVQKSVHQTDDEYFDLDAWWDVGIEFTINWISLATKFDMVICNYIFYSKVLELFDEKVTKVIDTHDIMSNRNYLLDKKLGYRDFFYVSPESEKKALDRAHLVLSIKEDESNWFESLSSTPILTIGHLEPEPSITVDRTIEYDNITLGFIGSANPINVKNLESFLDRYLALYGNCSELTFVVGGKVCQALDWRFRDRDRVRVIGMVDDVAEFYEQIDIAILPFEFSTGLKIKTVEALSWSKPCMGTINAFEGLGSNSKYHSYQSIEQLVLGIDDLIGDPQTIMTQLRQDSQLVFSSYSNGVKRAIEKLYGADWKTIKQIENNSNLIDTATSATRTYNFNIITNVDFWNPTTNEALWINFWLERARKLGNINVYRTQDFKNINSDKSKLYKLGLVDNVHQRELYQILDLFKISPDDNVACINLFDIGSIVHSSHCLQELEQIKIAKNQLLWYFCNRSSIDANGEMADNIDRYLKQNDFPDSINFWDLEGRLSSRDRSIKTTVALSSNPINLDSTNNQAADLERVTIATFCTEKTNITELDKLVQCCQDFLPQHFESIIFSDLAVVKDRYYNVYSLQRSEATIDRVDLIVGLENPKNASFLIYLAVCKGIPFYSKDPSFLETLNNSHLARQLDRFTSIPQAYKTFLEYSVCSEQGNLNKLRHQTWTDFLEYWVTHTQTNLVVPSKNYSTIN